MDRTETPWYADGLRFSCTRCGACCTGKPGYVWVGPIEIDRLATHLGLSQDEFGRRYLRQVGGDLSLIEKPNLDCVFWDGKLGCTVYEARPNQCQTWPFWPENVETPDDWSLTQRGCPGAGQGKLYTLDAITTSLERTSE